MWIQILYYTPDVIGEIMYQEIKIAQLVKTIHVLLCKTPITEAASIELYKDDKLCAVS